MVAGSKIGRSMSKSVKPSSDRVWLKLVFEIKSAIF